MKRILALVGLILGGSTILGGTTDVEIFGHGSVFGIPLGSIVGGSGLLIAGFALVSFRQLRESRKTGSSFTQFSLDQIQTSTAVTYSVPRDLAPATPANNEAVETWLGPIFNTAGGTRWGKETVTAENTLLFTPTQVIAIMLGPPDAANLNQGFLGWAASAVWPVVARNFGDNPSPPSPIREFRRLHWRHWDKLMAPLLQMPLSSVIQTHFNYSIPYDKVKSVEVKIGPVNPGLIFHLMDGSKVRYGVRKALMGEIEKYLQQRVTVDS